jgi:ABC-type Fe3+/spermidine/putrescine transport system ATPase subunit
MALVQLNNISKRYAGSQAVESVSLTVQPGEFLTLLGPSGCGKTTTLRVVAGLVAPTTGTVRIDGRDVTMLSSSQRGIGMVFQSLALFPHMTVAENVGFGLRMRRVSAAEIARRVQAMLAIVRLDHLAARYPNQLSGGQQQRVALARALVIEPSILILDEPFGALDRKLREAMQVELRQITRELSITALFVTHDQEEALMLSDLIAVMNQGRVDQLGTPQQVFQAPRTRFVADFMGMTNFLSAEWAEGGLHIGGALMPWVEKRGSGKVELGIRPEQIELLPGAAVRPGDVAAQVLQAVYHGTSTSYTLRLLDGQSLTAREPNEGSAGNAAMRFAAGDAVTARWKPDAVHLLQS